MATKILTAALLTTVLSLSACGKHASEHEAEHQAAEPAAKIASLERTPSPDGARVFFISPADGDTVSNPVRIEFGIEGMSVTKAGDDQPNSGHHHLVIDTDLPDLALPIPADANYVHFGDGRTVTEITLEPGQHSLRMLLGDHLHIPHDPPVFSDPITITVE
ncbi:MAG: DUF4399 domain-containing protein [Woeseiaceae bacterium]|jgi:hypothetical protein